MAEAGANLNQQSGQLQFTPIMRAVWEGSNDIVRFLKNQGVDLTIEDADGDDVLDIAELKNNTEAIQILKEK